MAEVSPRQREILSLVAAGCSNKEIASRLGISARTIETHLRRLYSRWGVNNRAAVVAKWLSGQSELLSGSAPVERETVTSVGRP